METLYKANSGILVNGKYYAFPTFASMVYMDGKDMTVKEYMEQSVDAPKATAVSYTVAVPTVGWTDDTLSYGGVTYTRKCVVTADNATANPVDVRMSYESGDYSSYCKVGLIDTGNREVTLWAQLDPTDTCQIRVVEVRNGQS